MEIVAAIPGNEDIALSTPVDEYPCNRGFTRSYHRPEAAVEAGAEFRGRLLVDSAPRVVALIMHGAPAVVPPLPPPALLERSVGPGWPSSEICSKSAKGSTTTTYWSPRWFKWLTSNSACCVESWVRAPGGSDI